MPNREWLRAQNGRLALRGYPISVSRGGLDRPFILSAAKNPDRAYYMLKSAKHDGEQLADEIDEFEGAD